MNPLLEILSQGEEIVTGQVTDTNAAWLSQQSAVLGFSLARHTAVGDKLDDLVQVLTDISGRADCCICTGGLGPTSDDLTAEAVSKAFGRLLEFDEIAYRQIRLYFEKRQRQMAECNRKQAMLPESSVRLDNHWGTAPGFSLQAGRCRFWFLPGVPSEMRQFFTAYVKPMMESLFNLSPNKLVTIKTVGIGESDLQECIIPIGIPPGVQLGFRAQLGEVQTKLLFPANFPHLELENLVHLITGTLGNFVFAVEGLGPGTGGLVEVVGRLMLASNKTLTLVETASQGLLSAKINGGPWLTSAFYYRSTDKLMLAFEVEHKHDDLMETLKSLALAVRKETGADMVLIQLPYKNEQLNQENESNIEIINTLLDEEEFIQGTKLISGDANRKQQLAALFTLDFLRRYLQDKNQINVS